MDGDVGFTGAFICHIVIPGTIMLLKCLYIVGTAHPGLILIVPWIPLDSDTCTYRRHKAGDEYAPEVPCRQFYALFLPDNHRTTILINQDRVLSLVYYIHFVHL